MKIALISLSIGVLTVASCASSPVVGQWHNKNYERDRKNSMRDYYSRDFNICLSRAIQAKTERPGASGSLEQQTDKCLHDGGWIQPADE